MGHSDNGESASVTTFNNGLQTQLNDPAPTNLTGAASNTRTVVSDQSSSHLLVRAKIYELNRTKKTEVYTKDADGKEKLHTEVTQTVTGMWDVTSNRFVTASLTVTIKDPNGTTTKTVHLNEKQVARALGPGVVEGFAKGYERLDQQWHGFIDRLRRWFPGK
jgi:hypothetical protein